MASYEMRKGNYLVSTDPSRLQRKVISGFIARSYWAPNKLPEVIDRAIDNSLCFGVYDGDKQVGLPRVATDFSTYAWLCDVFISENHRGCGLGKRMVACIMAHPDSKAHINICSL
jgi:hypothetical protein